MIDTLRTQRSLAQAGFTEGQVEAIIASLKELEGDRLTKSDLNEAVALLKSEIRDIDYNHKIEIAIVQGHLNETKSDLRLEIQELRAEMRTGFADLNSTIRTSLSAQGAAMSDMRSNIITWTIGIALAAVSLAFATFKLVG